MALSLHKEREKALKNLDALRKAFEKKLDARRTRSDLSGEFVQDQYTPQTHLARVQGQQLAVISDLVKYYAEILQENKDDNLSRTKGTITNRNADNLAQAYQNIAEVADRINQSLDTLFDASNTAPVNDPLAWDEGEQVDLFEYMKSTAAYAKGIRQDPTALDEITPAQLAVSNAIVLVDQMVSKIKKTGEPVVEADGGVSALRAEGIFRERGSDGYRNTLLGNYAKQGFSNGEAFASSAQADWGKDSLNVHDYVGVLKGFLMKPESIGLAPLPFNLEANQACVAAGQALEKVNIDQGPDSKKTGKYTPALRAQVSQALQTVLQSLPASHIRILQHILEVQALVAAGYESNKMTHSNLGIGVGPTMMHFLGAVNPDPMQEVAETFQMSAIAGAWVSLGTEKITQICEAVLEQKHALGDTSDTVYTSDAYDLKSEQASRSRASSSVLSGAASSVRSRFTSTSTASGASGLQVPDRGRAKSDSSAVPAAEGSGGTGKRLSFGTWGRKSPKPEAEPEIGGPTDFKHVSSGAKSPAGKGPAKGPTS